MWMWIQWVDVDSVVPGTIELRLVLVEIQQHGWFPSFQIVNVDRHRLHLHHRHWHQRTSRRLVVVVVALGAVE